MKTCLITTTVTTPTVLAEYRALDESVDIIVAGDVTGPVTEIAAFCDSINARFLSYEEQESLGYQCSPILGKRTIQRRCIAILEAIKSHADCIITTDTDNHPTGPHFFDTFWATLGQRHSHAVSLECGWYNPGRLTEPPHISRGFPLSCRDEAFTLNMTGKIPAGRIGIVQGIAIGDPDIAAIDRIVTHPDVGLPWADIRHVVPHVQDTWAPINSQSTGYVRELAPLMACLPGTGRFDDIWGGLIAQRVLMDTDWQVAFGQPFVRQIRHAHNLIADLKAELLGMEYTEQFCADLRAFDLSSADTILDKLELVYEGLAKLPYIPSQTIEFGFAWCCDVRSVL